MAKRLLNGIGNALRIQSGQLIELIDLTVGYKGITQICRYHTAIGACLAKQLRKLTVNTGMIRCFFQDQNILLIR